MILEQKFQALRDFLFDWTDFIDLEPIRKYPQHLPYKIESWVTEIRNATNDELVQLENSFSFSSEDPEFQTFLEKIRSLIEFSSPKQAPLDLEFTAKMKQKKRHEIETVASLLNGLDEVNIIDIGGGAGYLTENLINQRKRFSTSIDMDKTLQRSGEKRIKENNVKNSQKMEFVTHNFGLPPYPTINGKFKKSIVVGLHCCGDLSPHLMRYAIDQKSESLLSLGCCYHKLTDQYNLSLQAKKTGLSLTKNSLNLATRGYSFQTFDGLKRKFQIRTYRYGLHLYLFSLGHHDFIPTGRTNLADYEKSFAEYASIYAKNLIGTKSDAELFFQNESTQSHIKDIIAVDIIRGLLGRVIEAYLIVDRALFLQNHGYQVKVTELFDRKLSPRSLAIEAHLAQ